MPQQLPDPMPESHPEPTPHEAERQARRLVRDIAAYEVDPPPPARVDQAEDPEPG